MDPAQTQRIHELFRLKKRVQKCPSVSTTNINSEGTVTLIKEHSPDLLIVFGGRIIKPEVIRLFPKGILNLHLAARGNSHF